MPALPPENTLWDPDMCEPGPAGPGTDGHAAAPILAVVGPTATGKSALAVDLARALGGEVVSADAYALYRGMDIGTAKPGLDERRGVPHHQIDVLGIDQEASVAAYQRHARADLDDIAGRGLVPVLAGGSGLYVRAALDQLDIPPASPQVRRRLEQEAERGGLGRLHARLAGLDPVAAEAIGPRNARRIVRALEVIELTGRPFTATMPVRQFRRPSVLIGLDAPAEVLDERIGARVTAMWANGFLQEVAALEQRGLSGTRTAGRAVGYREALAQLRGELSEDEAIAATAQATRRLSRRQRSWFRADPRVTWLPAQADRDDLVARVLRLLRPGS